jgi:tetratricopeptide (TPR) repeat protein
LLVRENVVQSFQAALMLFQQGNFLESSKLCQLLIASDDQNSDALHLLGLIAYQTQQFSDAEGFLSKVIGLKPASAPLHTHYGLVLHSLGRDDEAVRQYEMAIGKNPLFGSAYLNLGIALQSLNRLEEALSSYDTAISIRNDDAEAFNNRGAVLFQLRRFEDSLTSYDKAIAIKPDYGQAFYNRGITLHELERFDEALASYDKAIGASDDIILEKANTLAALERYDDARDLYKKYYEKLLKSKVIGNDLLKSVSECSVLFVGVARDCAPYMQAVLANIGFISTYFKKSEFCFVTNNSKDSTEQLLHNWAVTQSNAHILVLNEIKNIPARTMRIAAARNAYLEFARHCESDFMLVVDMDDVSGRPFDPETFLKAIWDLNKSTDCAAVFPSQKSYYDIFAFREERLCPDCVFEQGFDALYSRGMSAEIVAETLMFETASRISNHIKNAVQPVEVQSAFGGLGIYKMSSVRKNKRKYVGVKQKIIEEAVAERFNMIPNSIAGWQVCEHVEFHRGFLDNGEKLMILPWFINCDSSFIRLEQLKVSLENLIDDKLVEL